LLAAEALCIHLRTVLSAPLGFRAFPILKIGSHHPDYEVLLVNRAVADHLPDVGFAEDM
jgi:hypothetical protein